MIIVHLGRDTSSEPVDTYQYSVAGHVLIVNRQVSALSPFLMRSQEAAGRQPQFILDAGNVSTCREVRGWVGRAWRDVACYRFGEAGCRIRIDGVGTFAIKGDGSVIALESPDISQDNEETIAEALLGPVLAIALATRGVFCLHASALLAGGRAFALLGDSGAGKSTLAASLADRVEGRQRLADDVLPVTADLDAITALPRFPQLKLPAGEQIRPDVPDRIPLGGVFVLDVPAEPARPAVAPLDSRAAAVTLIKHTVATSLFDERLLGPHIDFCASAAAHVPLWRLVYPHNEGQLAEVKALVAGVVEGLGAAPG